MRSKICASHDIIWACNDLVPQTWVIKPTNLCFVSRLSQSSTPATTPCIKPSEKLCTQTTENVNENRKTAAVGGPNYATLIVWSHHNLCVFDAYNERKKCRERQSELLFATRSLFLYKAQIESVFSSLFTRLHARRGVGRTTCS